ncbi:hypothetical protein ACGF07_07490 [Kitasatospora sp. NPDC048194]|uniref:hypothetical protein n=1 Tax=Kitasatospora sp. NPDC048194 TaxID=3364045 RepID=UPI0037146C25
MPSPSTTAAPASPRDFPCPGESPTTTPAAAPTSTGAPAGPPSPPDHYWENNGFKIPLPLHGQARCDGLSAVQRIRGALEPLRRRGDLTVGSTRTALTGLGFEDGKVTVDGNGAGLSFLIDATGSHLCLEGTVNPAAVTAEAFGGYPDHPGCDVPRGGH